MEKFKSPGAIYALIVTTLLAVSSYFLVEDREGLAAADKKCAAEVEVLDERVDSVCAEVQVLKKDYALTVKHIHEDLQEIKELVKRP